jgi:hypothetical protein
MTERIPESWTKKEIKKVFKVVTGIDKPYMPPATGMGRGGAADFIECINGHYIAVEAKASDGEQTALQKEFEKKIKAQGGVYVLVFPQSFKQLRSVLASLIDAPPKRTPWG